VSRARVDTGRVRISAAGAFLGVGVLAIALHMAYAATDVGIYDGIGLASAGAILVAAFYYRPPNFAGWLLVGAGQLLFASGDLVYNNLQGSEFPGPADALYIAGYVVWIAGIVVLIRSEFRRLDLGSHIDAVVVGLAVAVSLWAVFIDERGLSGSGLARGVAWAYPVADLLIITLLIRMAFLPGRRTRSYWLLVAATIPLAIADAAYLIPSLNNAYSWHAWTDGCWLFSYVALGAAALHSSMGKMTESEPVADTASLPIRRLIVLGISVLAIPVAIVIEDAWRGHVDVAVIATVAAVIIFAFTWRTSLIVRDLYTMRDRLVDSERRFRMIFERAPIGISVGRNGVMSETNPALHRMLGYTAEEFARMHYTDVTHEDDRSLAVQLELDAGERDSFIIDKQYVRKDGEPVDTRVHVSLDLDDGFGMSLIEDVTEQRALEDQLLQAQKMEAVGKLAGGIAHDFNNLMTAVIGYSELLLRDELEDVRSEKLEAIRESAVRASDLTRQLLAFSRRQIMQTEEIDLRDVVRSMGGLLEQVIGEDIHLEQVLSPVPVIVRADRTQLEQVVMNLVVNGREAMPGGGTLTVAVDNEHDDAVLVVADNGAGMDAATKARIFEPFFTTKALAEASGLGLSTVHGIVGQSGGTIEVESSVGRGTVFTTRLPRVFGARLQDAEAQATLVD
jgi:PAS domain S-box-containing protein